MVQHTQSLKRNCQTNDTRQLFYFTAINMNDSVSVAMFTDNTSGYGNTNRACVCVVFETLKLLVLKKNKK